MKIKANMIPKQAHKWEMEAFRRESVRPRQTRRCTATNDLMELEFSWKDVAAVEYRQWRQRVAQCIMVIGWINAKDHWSIRPFLPTDISHTCDGYIAGCLLTPQLSMVVAVHGCMAGWVDLGGWLHSKLVYLPASTQEPTAPSIEYPCWFKPTHYC